MERRQGRVSGPMVELDALFSGIAATAGLSEPTRRWYAQIMVEAAVPTGQRRRYGGTRRHPVVYVTDFLAAITDATRRGTPAYALALSVECGTRLLLQTGIFYPQIEMRKTLRNAPPLEYYIDSGSKAFGQAAALVPRAHPGLRWVYEELSDRFTPLVHAMQRDETLQRSFRVTDA